MASDLWMTECTLPFSTLWSHVAYFSTTGVKMPRRLLDHLELYFQNRSFKKGGGQLQTESDFRGAKLAIEDSSSGLSFETGDGQTVSRWLLFERNGHVFFDSRAFRRARGRGDRIDRALEVLEDHIAARATCARNTSKRITNAQLLAVRYNRAPWRNANDRFVFR